MHPLERYDREQQEEPPNVVILCLDDHYPTMLAHWLRSAGIRVEIAGSGRQAKQLLHSGDRVFLSPIEYSRHGQVCRDWLR